MSLKFENSELIGTVRVHIIIPKANKHSNFKPGISSIKEGMTYKKINIKENKTETKNIPFESVIINIDASNIEASNLFSKGFCDVLKIKLDYIETHGICYCNQWNQEDFICKNCNCKKNSLLCTEDCNCSYKLCNQVRKKPKYN